MTLCYPSSRVQCPNQCYENYVKDVHLGEVIYHYGKVEKERNVFYVDKDTYKPSKTKTANTISLFKMIDQKDMESHKQTCLYRPQCCAYECKMGPMPKMLLDKNHYWDPKMQEIHKEKFIEVQQWTRKTRQKLLDILDSQPDDDSEV